LRTRLPIQLKIVSWIFILGGISAAIEIFIDATKGHMNLNFGVLGIFVGIGLLHLKRGWRTLALVFLLMALIFTPIVGVLAISRPGNLDFQLFGQKIAAISPFLFFLLLAGFFALTLWQFRVLVCRDVSAIFQNRRG